MPDLFDYLIWRGDLTLEQSPFNDVDSLILCSLSYAALDGLVGPGGATIRQAAEAFVRAGGQWPKERRGGGMEFWEDALRLLGQLAQRSAAEYLRDAARRRRGRLRVGGHSKGGNLAVYAAAHTPQPVQARLEAVYNNDGPGFCAGALDETGYAAVRERIRTFVPQTSIVGMLLDHEERYTVVRSRQVGLLQHDPFSWQVEGPDFVRLETVTSSSRFLSLTLKNWVASMDRERREAFVDALFDILGSAGADTTEELSEGWLKNAAAILSKLRSVDDETRRMLLEVLRALLAAARESMPELLAYHRRRGG